MRFVFCLLFVGIGSDCPQDDARHKLVSRDIKTLGWAITVCFWPCSASLKSS